MAFNREDLITWNELSTSLQQLLKAMQDCDTSLGQKVDDNIEKTNELDSRVQNLEISSDAHQDDINTIYNELAIQDRVGESSLLQELLLLKAKFELHKLDPNAHKTTINSLINAVSSGYYSAWMKVRVPGLKTLLAYEAADQRITNAATTSTSYVIGDTDIVAPVDYEAVLKDVLTSWASRFVDTKRDTVITAILELHEEIYQHLCDTDAHQFSSTVFLAKNVNYMYEKGYKAFLPSKTLALIGSGTSLTLPSHVDWTGSVFPENQAEFINKLETELVTHLVSADHGLNTLEGLFNVHKMGYDTLTLGYPVDEHKFSMSVIGRLNTAAGGVDGTGVVEGMSFKTFGKFVTDAASQYDVPVLVDLKNKMAEHASMYSSVHQAANTNFLVHNPSTYYDKGNIIRVPGTPANLALYAMNSGTTSAISPDFGLRIDTEREVKSLREEIRLLKANIRDENLTPTQMAAEATAIREELVKHIYTSEVHLYNSSSCMTHTTDFDYELGETVRAPKIATSQMLECIEEGRTDKTASELIENTADIPTVEPADELNYEEYIEETLQMLEDHINDLEAHYDAFGQYMIRAKDHSYVVGDTVWAKGMNTSHMLECVTEGITNESELYVDIETESNLVNLINVHTTLMSHASSNAAHTNAITASMSHQVNTHYDKGDVVVAPGYPTGLALQATTSGMTGSARPNFLGRDMDVDDEYNALAEKLAELRGITNPTDTVMAEQATELAQALADHEVYPLAHYYNSSSCMTHSPGHKYYVGDIVYAPNINKDLVLECVSAGISAKEPPAEISDPYDDAATVTPATESNYKDYINSVSNKINNHDANKKAHEQAFGNEVFRQPSTHYDVGDVVVLNPQFKLECINGGITDSKSTIDG